MFTLKTIQTINRYQKQSDDAVVHYMHINKLWYFWLDNTEGKKFWRKIQNESDLKSVTLLSEEIISEHQAKELLKTMFPNNKIMKAFPFHASPSHFGSRPKKQTVDRKRMLREKKEFLKEISGEE